MYPLAPPAVYLHESVAADPRYRRRADRVIAALTQPVTPQIYRDEDLPSLIRDHGLTANRKPMGTLATVRDPILLFNTFRFRDDFAQKQAQMAAAGFDPKWGIGRELFGAPAFHWANYNLAGDYARHDKVCRPCWRIHLQHGCVHQCKYCGLGGLLISMVNVEDYCEHLGELIARHPWQQTYLLDDDGDPPCLEPEQGTLSHLIEYFGTLKDRYLIVHTKTWNTAWLRDLKHNGKTIFVWSLSGPTQSRVLEPVTGTTEQRLAAARTAQEAGYTVRFKFKPIIPVRGWREDATAMIAQLFAQVRPDNLSLCCFMWLEFSEMKRRLPLEQLEPAYVQAAEAAQAEMKPTLARPFPEWVRAEIYEHYLTEIRKHSRDVPVCLSTENFAMWKRMGKKLGVAARTYVCGCGPQSPPGAKRLACHPFASAVRADRGEVPGVF